MSVFYVPVIGLAAILLAMQLRELQHNFATYLVLAAGILIFFYSVGRIRTIVETLQELTRLIHLDDLYLKILIKIIGITYLCEFSADICKDSGFSSVAGQIQIFGKLTILAVSMPVIQALLGTLEEFL